MKANDQLFKQMKLKNTLLCCGLDPDLKKMPLEITKKETSDEDKVLEFLIGVVDVTAPHICAYKIQKAFFDILNQGHGVLKKITEYIHVTYPGIPVFIDCKIGDIENTMKVYIQNLFDSIKADGIVVNPYMGEDVMLPLIKMADKSIIVLVKTSNPSGRIIQDVILQNGQPLWRYILNLVVNHWNGKRNIIPVLSSTEELNFTEIRSLLPDKMPILLAGVGTQKGSYANLYELLNSEGIGVFINSSRSILYPKSSKPWKIAIEEVAIKMKEELNRRRIK